MESEKLVRRGERLRPDGDPTLAGVHDHPAPHKLETFMLGELPRAEAPAIVRHLLTECRQCVAVTRRLWRLGDPSPGLEALLREMVAEADARGVSVHDEPGLI